MARRSRAITPEERARRQEAKAEAARIRAQGAHVTLDRDGTIIAAYRSDVVEMMRASGNLTPDQVQAYRNLEALVAKAGDPSPSCLSKLDRVTGGGDAGEALSRKLDAVSDLIRREERMDPGTWAFLRELVEGGALLTRWRGVVERRTGERNPAAQAGAIRQVLRTLEAVELSLRTRRAA